MEKIKTFEIDIDLTDVDTLYDYARCEYIRRTAGTEWDYQVLKERAKDDFIDEEDETSQARVTMMDNTLYTKLFLEKEVKQSEKKGSEENEDVYLGNFNEMQPSQKIPKRLLPVYKPGDLVRGQLILELTDKIEAEKLRITFKGRALVRIRVYHPRGFYDDYGEEFYVQEETVFWHKADGKDVTDQFALLSTFSLPPSSYIPPGNHRFPFEYVIPADARGSVPDLINSYSDFGYLGYRLKALIDQGKTFHRGNIVTCKGIWVEKSFDIAKVPDEMTPITCEETLMTGFLVKSGKIGLKATLPRRAYIRGETIPVTLDIENINKIPIDSISARVCLHGKMRAGTGPLRPCRSLSTKSVKVDGESIPADTIRRIQLELPLDFNDSYVDSNLVPAGTLDDCKLLDVHYEIIIKGKRKGVHRDMELNIPITLGTENSATNLYPQL